MKRLIEPFAKQITKFPNNCQKFILIDEADGLATIAQQYLKYIIDNYAHNTCFILICNHINEISNSLRTSFLLLQYPKLSEDCIKQRLLEIMKYEHIVNYDNNAIDSIVFSSNGDMRNALNNLQTISACFDNHITMDGVNKLLSIPSIVILKKLVNKCIDLSARSIEAIDIVGELYQSGFSSSEIIDGLFRLCSSDKIKFKCPDMQVKFLKQIGCTCHIIKNVIDDKLQLEGLISKLCLISIKIQK
jgi:replication factor C subunit 2/4